MIAATSFGLGIAASGLKTVFAYALTAAFLLTVFFCATIGSAFSAAGIIDLALAIAGYNAGIGGSAFALTMLFHPARRS